MFLKVHRFMHIYALSDMQVENLYKDWPNPCIVQVNQYYSRNDIRKSNLTYVISSRLSTTGREKQQQHLTAYIQGPSLHPDLAWGLAGLAPQSQCGLIAWPYLVSPTLA